MSHVSLDSLISLSARIGQDLNLVQAGGGNTSIKESGTLWMKASGKWLVNAETDDIFLPVPFTDIEESMAANQDLTRGYPARSGALLRPSVETAMHAVLPQRVVIHVHSTYAIAWASRLDGQTAIPSRLEGLRWSWIPYIHPGLPLARRIQDDLAAQPEVLILGNHGLVVAADECDATEALLYDVQNRLAVNPQPAPDADTAALEQLTQGTSWSLAADSEVHALGTNLRFCGIASGGTMYPDHCVYLGPAAATLREGESIEQALNRYTARYNYQPAVLLVEGKGVITSDKLSRAGRELLVCLKRVVERIPAETSPTYLEDWQVAKLMNWDAEKYRISMARLEQ